MEKLTQYLDIAVMLLEIIALCMLIKFLWVTI